MNSRYSGVLLMLSATFFFGAGNLFVKLASNHVSSWEAVFFRGAGGLLFAWITARIRYGGFHPLDHKRLFLRGSIGALSISCFFFGIKHSSVTTATMLTYTFPVFGTLLALLLYKEKPVRFFWPLLGIALAGILLILNPTATGFRTADIISLVGGVLAGGAVSLVRKLRHTDKPETVFASFMLFSFLFSAPFALPLLKSYSAATCLALLAMIIFTSIAQIQMSRAYHTLTVSTGGTIQLLTVFFTAIFAAIQGEKLTIQAIIGGTMILAASAALLLLGNRRPRR